MYKVAVGTSALMKTDEEFLDFGQHCALQPSGNIAP
jgi:hypothetical protein